VNQDLLDAGAVLAQARSLLQHPKVGMESTWPRAAALLGRQALEEGIDAVLIAEVPPIDDLEGERMRPRLVCLGELVDHEEAHEAAWLWSRFSFACHHHPYELAPIAAELTEWIDRTDAFLQRAHARPTADR